MLEYLCAVSDEYVLRISCDLCCSGISTSLIYSEGRDCIVNSLVGCNL